MKCMCLNLCLLTRYDKNIVYSFLEFLYSRTGLIVLMALVLCWWNCTEVRQDVTNLSGGGGEGSF